MNFLGFEDSAKKLLNFASNQCLRPYACICRKISNFRLKLGDVVSMNDAGVLISCQIVDDEGRHMRQVFMDKDLTQCECRLEDRRTEVRAVLSNPQWKHVMAENGECIMLGARVDDFRLFANHPDAAVLPSGMTKKCLKMYHYPWVNFSPGGLVDGLMPQLH